MCSLLVFRGRTICIYLSGLFFVLSFTTYQFVFLCCVRKCGGRRFATPSPCNRSHYCAKERKPRRCTRRRHVRPAGGKNNARPLLWRHIIRFLRWVLTLTPTFGLPRPATLRGCVPRCCFSVVVIILAATLRTRTYVVCSALLVQVVRSGSVLTASPAEFCSNPCFSTQPGPLFLLVVGIDAPAE